MLMTNEPEPGTMFLTEQVESFVRAVARMIELAVTVELVTVRAVAAAAKLTVPFIRLIV